MTGEGLKRVRAYYERAREVAKSRGDHEVAAVFQSKLDALPSGESEVSSDDDDAAPPRGD